MSDPRNVISASYGNDSIAMLQWARETGLPNVTVTYCDTGWSAPGWLDRVAQGEAFARQCGFDVVRLQSMGMEDLVRHKKGFPGNGQQFCTAFLKGLPFLQWLDEFDKERTAIVLIGKRRAESKARESTPEFIEESDYHGGRKVWHPLFLHTHDERNTLLARAGFEPLPHRSQECSPCVNANREDFRLLTAEQIARVAALETEVGKTMFRPQRFRAHGIEEVVKWACYSPGQYTEGQDDLFPDVGCGSPFGCRT